MPRRSQVIELEWNSTRSLLPTHALCVLKFITPTYKDPKVGPDPECLKEVSWQKQEIRPWSKSSCVLLEKLPLTRLPLCLCRCVVTLRGG